MLKNVKIKYKIILMPVMALGALLFVLMITQFFSNQNEALLGQIENGHFPALEMNRDLVELLTSIQRSMQDAVVSQDQEMLEPVAALKDSFLIRLQDGKNNSSLDPAEIDALQESFTKYYNLATYVAREMILGNFNEVMTEKIGQMREQYNEISRNLLESTIYRKQRVVESFATSRENQGTSLLAILTINAFLILLLAAISIFLIRSIITPLNKLLSGARKIAQGSYDVFIHNKRKDEIGMLSTSFNEMAEKVKLSISDVETQNWLKSGQSELSDKIRGDLDLKQIAGNVINYLADYVKAHVGIMYFKDKKNEYRSIAGYAHKDNYKQSYKVGESLVGQAVAEKKCLLITNVPDVYLDITSGLGKGKPKNIVILPLVYNNEVNSVIELGSFRDFSSLEIKFLKQTAENIAIALHAAQAKIEMKILLAASQKQSLALQTQKEELREINIELQTAQSNTDNIFRNVNEGIFLLSEDLCIKSQYSLALERILSQDKLGGKNIINLLRVSISAKVLEEMRGYLELMFNSEIEEITLERLNPLVKLEIELKGNNGDQGETSHLSFRFKRIYDSDGNISELLSTVTDISEEVKLAQTLEDNLRLKQKDIEWLLNMMHIPQVKLESFLETMQTGLRDMDIILQNPESEKNYKKVLLRLRQAIEPVIEKAEKMEIQFFISQTNEFMAQIESLESQDHIDGKDFLLLVMILGDIKLFSREIGHLTERIGEVRREAVE